MDKTQKRVEVIDRTTLRSIPVTQLSTRGVNRVIAGMEANLSRTQAPAPITARSGASVPAAIIPAAPTESLSTDEIDDTVTKDGPALRG